MRSVLIGFFVLCLFLPAKTKGIPPVNITGQSHRIQGNTNADIDSSSSFDIRYPEDTLQLPLEDECYGIWSFGSGEIKIDPAAGARAGDFSVYTFAEGTLGPEMTTSAHAWSKYTFSPLFSELSIAYFSPSATAGWEGTAGFLFRDLTVPEILEQWNSDPVSREGIDLSKPYDMNPLHEYELILECYSFGDYTTSGDLINSITVTIIPEPSTLLLLGIGTAVLRKRRK